MSEPLIGLPPATCYRVHTQPDEHLGVFGAVWLADLRRALDAAPEIDVDTLAKAMWEVRAGGSIDNRHAAEIAAEYRRLRYDLPDPDQQEQEADLRPVMDPLITGYDLPDHAEPEG